MENTVKNIEEILEETHEFPLKGVSTFDKISIQNAVINTLNKHMKDKGLNISFNEDEMLVEVNDFTFVIDIDTSYVGINLLIKRPSIEVMDSIVLANITNSACRIVRAYVKDDILTITADGIIMSLDHVDPMILLYFDAVMEYLNGYISIVKEVFIDGDQEHGPKHWEQIH